MFSFACPGRFNPWDMLVVTKEFYFSDWLFLYYLARNMEPYLFRQMLLDHIVPEVQSEKSSLLNQEFNQEGDETEDDDDDDDDCKKLQEHMEKEEEDMDDHSLNSDDMENAPIKTSLCAVNEKRVKFA